MPPRNFVRELGRALNGRRISEADILTEWAVVRPFDHRGLTEVKKSCSEQTLVVGNVSGLTFAPGAAVMIGTHTGLPGRQIIAGAPPGRRGASRVPVEASSRTYGSAPASPCPASRTGRSYLGIHDDGTSLHAFRYTDGAYQETLAVYDYSGDGLFSGDPQTFQRVHTVGDSVLFARRDSPSKDLQIITWDVDANALAVLECIHPTEFINWGCSPIWNGAGFAYFFYEQGAFSPRTAQMYKVAIGASGTWNEVTSRVGTTTVSDGSGVAIGSNLMGSSATVFQVASINFGESPEEVCIMHFDGTAWDDGLGRSVLAAADDPGNGFDGYAISGGRSIRITYTMPGFVPAIGIVPAPPATPETSLLPGDWTFDTLLNLNVSPSGAEFAAILGIAAETNKLVRLGIADDFALAGCPIPQITIEPAPGDIIPSWMLCRDN